MTTDPFKISLPFATKPKKNHHLIHLVSEDTYKSWLSKQSTELKAQIKETGFSKECSFLSHRSTSGKIKKLYAYIKNNPQHTDFAKIYNSVKTSFSSDILKNSSFGFEDKTLKKSLSDIAYLGWGMAGYSFKITEDKPTGQPTLIWAASANKKYVQTQLESIYLLRNLINIPTITMGPDELEAAARKTAGKHKATVKVTKGKALENGFPLVHAVGMASHRAPRLIEINWGNPKHKKLCLVGKGVCFDTGGLDIKPSQYMRYMKKDMGGAAHALALANIVMALKLPVRLQMLIPAVENAVAAESFRPGDVFKSRKGLTVENTNTDAEGRLILADTLTYASEGKPDLIIDFATLTGSARAALGQDIPAMFANDESIGKTLQTTSITANDPLWQMPLWDGYSSIIKSSVADLHNSAGVPGDLIYSALFLQSFLLDKPKTPNWVHIDCFAWESSGRPGRAKGGCDTGLRAAYAFLEKRYG